MWTWLKYEAAGKGPDWVGPKERQRQLGEGATIQDGILYNRLLDRHPNVARRHDEDIAGHFERLKNAEQRFQQSKVAPGMEQRNKAREQGKIRTPAPIDAPPTIPWTGDLARAEDAKPDLKGMPQRVPGQYVPAQSTDFPHQHMPGYEFGLPQRTPGDSFRPSPYSADPSYKPHTPTHDEWVQSLADKGVYLNPDGTRMSPEQMAEPLPQRKPRPLTGPEIWQPLVDYNNGDWSDEFLRGLPEDNGGLGTSWSKPWQKAKSLIRGRKASTTVTDYIASVMEKVAEDEIPDPPSHRKMLSKDQPGGPWSFEGAYPGASDSVYTKGDHVIVKDGRGWIHRHGDENPRYFDDLGKAWLHAEHGVSYQPIVARPPTDVRHMSSWRDVR